MCGHYGFQVLLGLSNILILLIGLAILGLGLGVRPVLDFIPDDSRMHMVLTSIIAATIATGSILSISGTLGCCGAIYKIICLLRMYIVTMIVVMLLQIGAGISMLVLKKQIMEFMTDITKCKLCTELILTGLKTLLTPSAMIIIVLLLIQLGLIIAAVKLNKHLVYKAKRKGTEVKNTAGTTIILNTNGPVCPQSVPPSFTTMPTTVVTKV